MADIAHLSYYLTAKISDSNKCAFSATLASGLDCITSPIDSMFARNPMNVPLPMSERILVKVVFNNNFPRFEE